MGVVEDVAARLRTQVPSRTVYEYAVPDGPLPAAYVLVRSAVTDEESVRMCGTVSVETSTVRVLSVARNNNPHVAGRTADAGSAFCRAALRGYRPGAGQWRLVYETGSDAYRDDSLPETTYMTALQYSLRRDL